MEALYIIYTVIGSAAFMLIYNFYKKYIDMQKELFEKRLTKVGEDAIRDAEKKNDDDLYNSVSSEINSSREKNNR